MKTRRLTYKDGHHPLYIVATPIGNLKEMTPRALEILNMVDFVACEDTRHSGLLLSHFSIKKPLIACHEHNEAEASEKIIALITSGKTVAYMSDAGYPGISDPGERLIAKAIDQDIDVSVISGSNAMLLALIGSGLPTEHFYFHGFLPSKASARKVALNDLASREETLIFYESPHRIIDTLHDLLTTLGNRKAVIARELTKLHEEYIRGELTELVHLDAKTLLGEMVLIIEGNHQIETIDLTSLIPEINQLAKSKSKKDIASELSEKYHLKKNDVYRFILETLK